MRPLYLASLKHTGFPARGRFLPGGTLVVRNVLSGGGEKAA